MADIHLKQRSPQMTFILQHVSESPLLCVIEYLQSLRISWDFLAIDSGQISVEIETIESLSLLDPDKMLELGIDEDSIQEIVLAQEACLQML
jgi:hypothetical protein